MGLPCKAATPKRANRGHQPRAMVSAPASAWIGRLSLLWAQALFRRPMTQTTVPTPPEPTPSPLSSDLLRWRCDPKTLSFNTTAEITPETGVVGQEQAIESLRFALETKAPDQNVYARGLVGSGRMTTVRRVIKDLDLPCEPRLDRCFVHNFVHPDRPRLISLPAGKGRMFRRRMRELGEFLEKGLSEALRDDLVKTRREAIEAAANTRIEALTEPFKEELKGDGLALVTIQSPNGGQTLVFPVFEGKPVSPEEFETAHNEKKVSDEEWKRFKDAHPERQKQLGRIGEEIGDLRRKAMEEIRDLAENTVRQLLQGRTEAISKEFAHEGVTSFLKEIVDDVIERGGEGEGFDPKARYGVNVILEQVDDSQRCPVVIENTPTLSNLLGTVEPLWGPQDKSPDYDRVRPGALLRADGGFLVLDARDVLSEPGAWKVLVRTLRTSRLEIVPSEVGTLVQAPAVKPEAIPIQVRVILVGDAGLYYMLDQRDPDFAQLFKVLADFETTIPRDKHGVERYGHVVARVAEVEGLQPFDASSIAALAEHGARIGGRKNRLTSRFSRVIDIAREAAYVARKSGAEIVNAEHVRTTIDRTKHRASLPSRRFQEMIAEGGIRIETEGEVAGQINGLAVMQAGPLTYGFPARITASVGAGTGGVIDIEGMASMSGSIHTKGFHILRGLLQGLMRAEHPLAFSASLAFEQSYGGIDGDSASGAETCCLLSALAEVPIQQGMAMTGAIDQRGQIQVIGGVNEKIEGFFDVCAARGLTGKQGVVIPKGNVGDLMLRPDVVEACDNGKFKVCAVDTIQEAMSLMMGGDVTVGAFDEESNCYPEGSVLRRARERVQRFWKHSSKANAAAQIASGSEGVAAAADNS